MSCLRTMASSSKPTVAQLTEYLGSLNKWQTFGGFLLGIQDNHIEKIELDCHGVDNQKRGLYSKWLEVCPDASWQNVITALEKADKKALAADIKRKLSSTETAVSPPDQGKK